MHVDNTQQCFIIFHSSKLYVFVLFRLLTVEVYVRFLASSLGCIFSLLLCAVTNYTYNLDRAADYTYKLFLAHKAHIIFESVEFYCILQYK